MTEGRASSPTGGKDSEANGVKPALAFAKQHGGLTDKYRSCLQASKHRPPSPHRPLQRGGGSRANFLAKGQICPFKLRTEPVKSSDPPHTALVLRFSRIDGINRTAHVQSQRRATQANMAGIGGIAATPLTIRNRPHVHWRCENVIQYPSDVNPAQ